MKQLMSMCKNAYGWILLADLSTFDIFKVYCVLYVLGSEQKWVYWI